MKTKTINKLTKLYHKLMIKIKKAEELTAEELITKNENEKEKLIQKANKLLKKGEEVVEIDGKIFIRKKHDDLYISYKKMIEHIIAFGKTRVGKSVIIKRFMRAFLEERRKNPHLKKKKKMMVVAVKGDEIEEFYNEEDFILVNPFDVRGFGIDIFSLLEVSTDIPLLLSNVVPDNPKSDPIWVIAPRDIIEAGVNKCFKTGKKTNKELSRILKLSAKEMLNEFSYAVETEDGKKTRKAHIGCEKAFQHLSAGTQGENILSGASVYFEIFHALADSENNINIREYLENDERNIIFANFSKIKDKMAPILSLFINQVGAIILNMKADPDRNILIIMDEFGSLKKMEMLTEMLQKGASFGLTLFILLQEFGPIDAIYGKDIRATFFSNTGIKLFFNTPDHETRQVIQKLLGTQTIKERTENHSAGDTDSRDGFSNNYQTVSKDALREDIILAGLAKHEFFYFETEVSERKDGKTFVYMGRIRGATNPEIDKRDIVAEKFIIKDRYKIDNYEEFLRGKDEDDEEDEIIIEETAIIENENEITTTKEERKKDTVANIKDKFNKSKLSKQTLEDNNIYPDEDLDIELSDSDLEDFEKNHDFL